MAEEDTSTQDLLEAIGKHWIQSQDDSAQNSGQILLKGQEISEGVCGVFNSRKKTVIASKKWLNQ